MGAIHRRLSEHEWEGVAARSYGGVNPVEKHELIGPSEGASDYRVAYFRIPVGGRTARERQPHDHAVLIEHGRARVSLGEEIHDLGPGDVVFARGDELRCIEALGDKPVGFVCVAPARPSMA